MAAEEWQVTVRGPDGWSEPRTVVEDIDYPTNWRHHLLAIARMNDPMNTDGGEAWIGLFELEVRRPGHVQIERIFRWAE